ncbi:MAG: hypothetical protein F6K54_01400 [Okeania sp. SIO3B5]|uniref:hypothetical protein n=1 Tax=Okeania sp. SIO3B5 TaxID=2607811 RepID=UPI0013FF2033|nr:hypothetical protein [Okeania sp. SIO3B5]NEO51858.1 hypothetical protein [Okeania sp. SIO3B5]
MLTQLTPIFFAVDPIITPILVGKILTWLTLGTAVASIVITVLDPVVEKEWKRLSNSQKQKVKKIKATAYKFWENHGPKIKFVVNFLSPWGTVFTSAESLYSWSSFSPEVQNTLTNQGSISQDYAVNSRID